MSNGIVSPYDRIADLDIKEGITSELAARQIDLPMEIINFLATTATIIAARRFGDVSLVKTTLVTLTVAGHQATFDFGNTWGLQGVEWRKAAITSVLDAAVTVGVSSLVAGMSISFGAELLMVFGITYSLSQMISSGYDRFIDYLAFKTMSAGEATVKVYSPYDIVLERYWDDLKGVPEWTLASYSIPLELSYNSLSAKLEINRFGLHDEQLWDVLLKKIGSDFFFIERQGDESRQDYVLNYRNMSVADLESISHTNAGLSALIALRPYTLESDAENYNKLNQEEYSSSWREDRAHFLYRSADSSRPPIDGKIVNFIDMGSGKSVPQFPTPVAVRNIIFGSDGGDTIRGTGSGPLGDHLYGGKGDDVIYGQVGNDYIEGGPGSDRMYGSFGDDVFAVYGADVEPAYDEFNGGDQFDRIIGGQSDDTIRVRNFSGENRVEEIDGKGGIDTLAGTREGDAVDIAETKLLSVERIDLGEGDDTLKVSELKPGIGLQRIYGGGGTDKIIGTEQDNVFDFRELDVKGFEEIYGEGGRDFIRGTSADEEIYGGADNDFLDGGLGEDTLLGGWGDDLLIGGEDSDRDVLRGSVGFDRYYVGPNDEIYDLGGKGVIDFSGTVLKGGVRVLGSEYYVGNQGIYRLDGRTLTFERDGQTVTILNFSNGTLGINLVEKLPPLPDWPSESRYLPRRDPLVLDLNGNGIQTVGTSEGIRFDYDSNGFKELTGWIAPGDGMLMLDRNGDGALDHGAELFGDFTPLQRGLMAVNGFQALAQFDANGDGRIDAQDPIWSQLMVWQHDPEYQDQVVDPDVLGKLVSVDGIGIKAIYLDSTPTNETDEAANTALLLCQISTGCCPNGTGAPHLWTMVPFLPYRGSRPAHFKELRTGDARPLRLTARDSAGTASPLAVPLAVARGHRVPHSVTP